MDYGLDLGWTQTLTIIGSMASLLVVSVWTFYMITAKRMDRFDSYVMKMDSNHRDDMKIMDQKFMKLDEKWERLFERLLLKDRKVK